MRCKRPLRPSRRCARNHVFERRGRADAAQAARAPALEVCGDRALERFAKDAPGLPPRTCHDGDVGKLGLRTLGPIAAAQRLHQPHHFAALLQSHALQGVERQCGKQRIGGNEQMCAGDQHAL